jgi:hypothetical protein
MLLYTHGNSASTVSACARSQANSLDGLENLAALELIDLKYSELAGLRQYFSLIAAKARAVADGPGGYKDFNQKGSEEGAARKVLSAVMARCSEPEIKDSALCAELKPDSSTVRLMVLMLLHWQPKTLPR